MKRSPFPLLILIYICLSTTVIWIYQKSKKDSNQSGLKKLSSIAWNDTTSNKSTTLSQVPQLVANGSEKAVTLKNLSIQTKIEGNIATTSYEMQFYNSEKRDLETELNFPLGENQTITRFVMDVNGKLREGVAIEKQKARVAFESTIRKNIDPGLVEMTKGNNFKARVFPVPAPAITQTGPREASATARCSLSNALRISSARRLPTVSKIARLANRFVNNHFHVYTKIQSFFLLQRFQVVTKFHLL
jgi:hypothetical protein